MINLFKFDSYKDYLNRFLDEKKGTVTRTQVAAAMGMQTGYLSQVLHGSKHFSSEQLMALAIFFQFSESETEFLLTLGQENRAGTKSLQDFCSKKLERLQLNRQRLPLNVKAKMNSEDLAEYHSHWYYYASHMALLGGISPEKKAIASLLGISQAKADEALVFLTRVGLIRREKDKWVFSEANPTVGRHSGYVNLVHRNLRVEAIKSLDRREDVDAHYSFFFLCDTKEIGQLQEDLAETVLSFNETLKKKAGSKGKKLYGFCLDCFSYGA